VPPKTVPEFIAYADNPGKINFASPGNRAVIHLCGELFQNDDRCEHGSRAVSRQCSGGDRFTRRAGAGDVRRHAAVDRAY